MPNRVTVNGIEMAFDERPGATRPLVLVHGFTGSADDFREHLDPLAALGRTIAIDQRGHGDSTNTGDRSGYTLNQLADDLRGFLDTQKIECCDLLGHSMGGMVALRFALAHPQRTASLILMDTAAGAVPGIPRSAFEGGAKLGRDAGMSQLAAILRGRAETDPQRPAASRRCEAEMGSQLFWDRIHHKLSCMDPEAFGELGGSLVEQESVAGRLNEISCPTLVMVGEEDRPFLAPADELGRGIPHARRVTIANAAHSPQLENPAAWLAAVRDHLQRARA
jgi:pimeloyl-ACP methyl ester carboxylesterase